MRDAMAEGADNDLGVFGEASGEITSGPATSIFESLRKIPVVERAKRADFLFEERVSNPLIVVETFRIGLAGAIRLHAGPADGETIAIAIHLGEKRDVFLIAMIGITGDVAREAALHFAGGVREAVPDVSALPALL